jgi:hypothetical protein
MQVFITIPAMTVPHGGIRVLIELANRLAAFHDVKIISTQRHCDWMKINVPVIMEREYKGGEVLIIGSPHHIHLTGKKTYTYCQMLEHHFAPNDRRWVARCHDFYTKHEMISISHWNMDYIKSISSHPIHYTDTGVSYTDFPTEIVEKDFKTVLIEGWETGNISKDSDNIAAKVASRLKDEGYKILVYSSKPLTVLPEVPDEYHYRPSLEVINDLYRRATILIKATHMDARACAPLEAMTKGCVTVRAIDSGDDDLIHNVNCLRCDYNEERLYTYAKILLTNRKRFDRLQRECYKLDRRWERVVNQFNHILGS